MFEFLKDNSPKNVAAPGARREAMPAQPTPQHSQTILELIRAVFKDTLRMHGIPSDWLACETIIIPRGPAAEELHIQLVVMKWNESLLRYASALQQQLLSGLDRFAPSVDHSKYVVSWRFSPACACPVNLMPEPEFWAQKEHSPALDEKSSIRDWSESKWPGSAPLYSSEARADHGKNDDDDYERTKLSPLSLEVRDDHGKNDGDDYERTKLSPLSLEVRDDHGKNDDDDYERTKLSPLR
jgi:hypothetical protein